MLMRIGYDIAVTCPQDTPMISMLSVREDRRDDIFTQGAVITEPAVPTTLYRDSFGNTCRRFVAPAGRFSIRSESLIRSTGQLDPVMYGLAETPVAQLPDDCILYLLPSRYCDTDRMMQLAWDLFANTQPGWSRVQAICDYVHNHIRFNYLNARVTRTAFEGLQEATGVCRDFAHLAIAFCRCMNIPARYVNGYIPDIGVPVTGPMDYAAWMEVYLSGRWWTFDPRNNIPRIGRVVVAHGRDAADVPLIHSFGPHVLDRFVVLAEQVAEA
jgi:transglutaminase-like putative cysteine protease